MVVDLGFHPLIIGYKVEAPKVVRISILSKLNFNLLLHACFPEIQNNLKLNSS